MSDNHYFRDAPHLGPPFKRLSSIESVPIPEVPKPTEVKMGPMAKACPFIVTGQGTICVENPNQEAFYVMFPVGDQSLVLYITTKSGGRSSIWLLSPGVPDHLASFPNVHVDDEKKAHYWVSYHGRMRKLKYGVGEMRAALTRIDYDISKKFDSKDLEVVGDVYFSESLKEQMMGRDPVVIEPPLRIRPTSLITLEDAAGHYYAAPVNLTKACQTLYGNISGASFQIDYGDFPQFSQAIERSIKSPNGWCHKTLEKKAGEFGKPNIKATYLRITLGVNQGDSPGIPYVMEIWPPGHYSPIHDHGWSHAVIRVLYGQIQAELFPMLSPKHEKSFATTVFDKDDVTWISPTLNQFHRLTNINEKGPTCITIQCYMYGDDDHLHYPYFDYLSEHKIKQFDPNSDADYLEFRKIMKTEWDTGVTAPQDDP